jgi:hypothetical protein
MRQTQTWRLWRSRMIDGSQADTLACSPGADRRGCTRVRLHRLVPQQMSGAVARPPHNGTPRRGAGCRALARRSRGSRLWSDECSAGQAHGHAQRAHMGAPLLARR